MNWTKNAQDDLEAYKYKKASIENLQIRIAEISCQMVNLKSQDLTKDRVQGGAGNDETLLSLIDEKKRLEDNLRMVEDFIAGVERGMKCLTDDEKTVLEGAYINGRQSGRYVEEVCEKINYCPNSVDNIRKAALKKFTMARYGFVEG